MTVPQDATAAPGISSAAPRRRVAAAGTGGHDAASCPPVPALRLLAWVLCGSTFLLIVLGALVTGFGVGMAVPDWPTTFGENMFTFSMADAPWSVQLEHGHRLLGALVGLLTLILAVWLWVGDSRNLVRGLGLLALFAVMIQGLLGGLRVVQIDARWGIVHGALAQAFFTLTVALLALIAVGTWYGSAAKLGRLAWMTAGMIYLQAVTGSLLRHTGWGLSLHLVLALGVIVHVFLLNKRVLGKTGELPRSAAALSLACGGIAVAQLFLGALSWMTAHAGAESLPERGSTLQAIVTSAHVAAGALLLGLSVFLALRIQPPALARPREASA